MKFSIAIPSYEYGGYGASCLEHSFLQMEKQTYKDFDVVISDSSVTNEIKRLCDKWRKKLNIHYYKNKEAIGNPAKNFNNAMKKATGDWIKLLCQDDYFSSELSLQKTIEAIDEKHDWLASGYLHTYDRENFQNYHFPYLNPRIYIINTIGTPSCVSIKNTSKIMEFDENLSYGFDCEFYYRYFLEYGPPKILEDITVINYLWGQSITAKLTNDLLEKENNYVLRKHGFINNGRDD